MAEILTFIHCVKNMLVKIGHFVFAVLLILVNFSCGKRGIFFEDETGQLDEKCITVDNKNGLCTDIKHCLVLTGKNKFPKICGFNGPKFKQPIVCCPVSSQLITRNGSDVVILKEVTAPVVNFECGRRGSGIQIITLVFSRSDLLPTPLHVSAKRRKRNSVLREPSLSVNKVYMRGGGDARRSSWPWMALFGRKSKLGNYFFCDGALINEQFVITAAYCVLDINPFFIRLGEHNYESLNGRSKIVNIDAVETFFHPQYKLNEGHHDLALVKLAHKAPIWDEVRPVCLPWGTPSNADLIGTPVRVTGWGAKYYGGPPSPILQEVQLKVFDPQICHKRYSSLLDFKSRFPEGMLLNNTLCAGDKEGGKDACQGDSGGPLVSLEGKKWTLGGIISQGYGCGNREFPGLYVPIRNTEYLQWIKDVAFT